MLGALGVLGVVLAGLALPMAFGDEDDDDEPRDAPRDDDTVRREGEGQEIGADLSPAEDDGAAAGEGDGVGEGVRDGAGEDDRLAEDPLADEFLTDEPPPGDPPPGDPAPEGSEPTPPGLRIDGGAEAERIVGGDGADDLGGGGGDDTLEGGAGDDRLFGDWGDDRLEGGAGDDRLADGSGDDTLLGGAGDDHLSTVPADGEAAFDGRDVLDGGEGDDTLVLGAQDHATGGAGADTFMLGPGLVPFGAGDAATLADFDPAEDSLVVVWDDWTNDAPPEIALSRVADDPDMVEVLADGVALARLSAGAGLGADDITLLPASQFPA
ncbi:MAG: Hemolysin-type calcium-binding repeat (2 copies) [Rhodobacteraceae bacterium HLUCCA09]|nr:MAG: Hemolysin-type calcium-binding repeat (2 copies) [Rhodobacteraceae bacterium HLUCCA09]